MGYIAAHEKAGTLVKTLPAPGDGTYVTPAIVKVGGIADMEREIFGPVLHVATFKARRHRHGGRCHQRRGNTA